jgi:hypothetical protein
MKSIMKTPREILLERHQQANPRLDAIRENIVASECRPENRKSKHETRNASVFTGWRELLWPSPWAWAGAAAAWVLIFALNFAASAGPDGASMANARALPASVVEMALAERQSLMTSLLDASPMEPAAPPRELIRPRPRSERKSEWFCA